MTAGQGLRPGVRRPVSIDTPDRTDAHPRNSPASEARPKRAKRTLRTTSHRNPSAEALARLYMGGKTLRQIGLEIGRCHPTVRYHLVKLPGYRRMVTTILLRRFRQAQREYTITRTRENERRLKHTVAMLRQKRPTILSRLIERTKPKRCPVCARPVDARAVGGMWRWDCGHCGDRGLTAWPLVSEL